MTDFQETSSVQESQANAAMEADFPQHEASLRDFITNFFQAEPASEETYKQLREDWRYLHRNYGLQISLRRINRSDQQNLTAERMTFADAAEAIHIFRQEISKYPPAYIAKLDITRIRILETLSQQKFEDDESVGGLSYEAGDIYIANGWDNKYYRKTIHHEISHRADFEQSELKDTIPLVGHRIDEWRDERFDDQWAALNPSGADAYMDDKWKEWRDKHPKSRHTGFARNYGLKNAREDRATVYEALMVETQELLLKGNRDKVLQAKTQRMIQLMKQRSDGLMNEQYFTDLAAGKIDEDYWVQAGLQTS